ncbi:hypothetical protein VTI74DRAFT_2609 [Chaetomium olivicolor]
MEPAFALQGWLEMVHGATASGLGVHSRDTIEALDQQGFRFRMCGLCLGEEEWVLRICQRLEIQASRPAARVSHSPAACVYIASAMGALPRRPVRYAYSGVEVELLYRVRSRVRVTMPGYLLTLESALRDHWFCWSCPCCYCFSGSSQCCNNEHCVERCRRSRGNKVPPCSFLIRYSR